MARRLNKTADVTVKVMVDETGKVIESELAGERAGFGFDEAALQAAKSAVFEPATKNGVKVKMWSSFKISFR
jgi:protein TonB